MLYPIELGVLEKSLTGQDGCQLPVFRFAQGPILQQFARGAQMDCCNRERIGNQSSVASKVNVKLYRKG